MKNKEILNIWSIVNHPVFAKTISEVKSTRFQWWKGRNVEKLQGEVKKIFETLESMKSDELKEAQKEGNKSPDLARLIAEFEAKKEVVELLDIESEIVLRKVKIEDLPADLDERAMVAVNWMIED